jgi:hypothetical protein
LLDELDSRWCNLLTRSQRCYGNGKLVEVSVVLLGGSAAIQVRDQWEREQRSEPHSAPTFERSGQDDSTSGLGLGLYITRQSRWKRNAEPST